MRKSKKNLEEDEEEYDDDDDYEDDDDDHDDDKYSRRGGRREGASNTKKIIIVIFVIIILILAIYAVLMLNPTVKSLYVEDPIELNDGSGIEIKGHIALEGSGTVNGEGDLKIKYDGKTVYSSKITVSNDLARKSVPYNKFVVGNDQYEIEIDYSGKTESTFFELHERFGWGVAEHLNITTNLDKPVYDPIEKDDNIHITVFTRIVDENNLIGHPPKEANVQITIEHEDGTPKTFNQTIKYPDSSIKFDDYDYMSTGNGNYTISAKITNIHAKEGSEFHVVELDEPEEVFLNIDPVADAGDDKVVLLPPLGDGILDVDGSNSWNDGVLQYQWDFDYKDENDDEYDTPDFTVDATGVTANKKYNDAGTYTVALRVIGIFIDYVDVYDEDTDKFVKMAFYEQDIVTINVRIQLRP